METTIHSKSGIIYIQIFFLSLVCFLLNACGPQNALMDDQSQQLKVRQMQTRYFDTDDKQKTLEAVMATLQDLGFVIDKASYELGSISATKLSGYSIKMTVTVRPQGEKRMVVRANAQFNISPITSPETYQQFFVALEKSIFLQAHLEE